MLKEVKIIDRVETEKLVQKWPADVSFSHKFGQLHTAQHGFKSGYVSVKYEENSLFFPVEWGNVKSYSVHKAHTMPIKIGTGNEEPEWHKIADEVRRLTKSDIYIADLALPEDMAKGLSPLPSAVFIIAISGRSIEALFEKFNKTTRNLVRRSQEQGFRVEIISGTMPDEFYSLYVKHQRSMGTPPRPKKYFDEVAKVFRDGFVVIGACHNGHAVGMNLAWCAERGLWLSINASTPEYSSKHVNYLLYYEMIKWACANGIDRIDLGGSSTRGDNIHNSFKLGFGAQMTPLYRLVSGSYSACFGDWLNRKKRNFRIRWNKIWKN